MYNSECSVANLVFEGISVDASGLLNLFAYWILFVFTMDRDRRVIFFVMKYFIDGNAMSSGQYIFVSSLSVKLSGVLFECDWFDGLYFFEIESLGFIVKSFAFDKRLSYSWRLIEAYLFGILVGLSLDSTCWIFPSGPDFHFQIADHLNDHYYILNPTNLPILLSKTWW